MKIRVTTCGRTITVDMTEEQARKTFNDLVAMLSGMSIETAEKRNEPRHILPRKEAEEIKRNRYYFNRS